jgi:hypothetical protein
VGRKNCDVNHGQSSVQWVTNPGSCSGLLTLVEHTGVLPYVLGAPTHKGMG